MRCTRRYILVAISLIVWGTSAQVMGLGGCEMP